MAYGFPVGYQPAQLYPQYQPTYQPYPQPMQANPPQAVANPAQTDDRIFVNGMQEADSWIVQRGQTVRLWDRNGSSFYIKSVSESGQPLPLEVYDYAKRAQEPRGSQQELARDAFNPDDFVRRDEFEALKEQIKASKRPGKKAEEKSDDE